MKIVKPMIAFILCIIIISFSGCGDSDVDASKSGMTNTEAIEYLDKRLNDFYMYIYLIDGQGIRTRSVYQGISGVYDIGDYWLVTIDVTQEIQRFQDDSWVLLRTDDGKMNVKYYKDNNSVKVSD